MKASLSKIILAMRSKLQKKISQVIDKDRMDKEKVSEVRIREPYFF